MKDAIECACALDRALASSGAAAGGGAGVPRCVPSTLESGQQVSSSLKETIVSIAASPLFRLDSVVNNHLKLLDATRLGWSSQELQSRMVAVQRPQDRGLHSLASFTVCWRIVGVSSLQMLALCSSHMDPGLNCGILPTFVDCNVESCWSHTRRERPVLRVHRERARICWVRPPTIVTYFCSVCADTLCLCFILTDCHALSAVAASVAAMCLGEVSAMCCFDGFHLIRHFHWPTR